jgi:predicted nuclease with RNAse H fold
VNPELFAGVDVGGRRKGFHLALIDHRRVVHGPLRAPTVDAVVEALVALRPVLVAVDAPCAAAPDGARIRACEVAFVRRRICGIRPTPDRGRLAANPSYYGWIANGLALYEALRREGLRAIECFPTAAWTIWGGERGRATRARWSAAALGDQRVAAIPPRCGQDSRDALGAALVARAHASGACEAIGDIVVPLPQRLVRVR